VYGSWVWEGGLGGRVGGWAGTLSIAWVAFSLFQHCKRAFSGGIKELEE
jgi:hypothetical protein